MDLGHVAAGNEPAAEDHRQPGIERFDLVEQVAGHQEAPRARPLAEKRDKIVAADRIEADEGLVEHEQVGTVGDRPSQLGPLPHSLGERGEWSAAGFAETHAVDCRIGQLAGWGGGVAGEPHEIRDPVAGRGLAFEEVGRRAVADPGQDGWVAERLAAEDRHAAHRGQ